MTRRTLIKGGCVLTLGARTTNYPVGDVLIEDGVVSEVGTGLRARGAELIDATDTIVMPGFVDAHRHTWMSLFRNAGDSVSTDSLLPHMRPDDVYAATLIGLLSAAEAGITTVVDWSDPTTDPEFTEAVLQAHRDSRLRTVLLTVSSRAVPGGSADLTTIARGEGETDFDSLASGLRQALDDGLRAHIHAGTHSGNDRVPSNLAQRGLLSDAITLVHCTNLSGAEFETIAQTGAKVVLTPSSEMATGLGMPPLQMLIDNKVRPGLGVDSDGIGPGDMFAQMRAANSIQHATLFDLKLAGKGGIPGLLSTRDVIRYATIEGALAVGLGSVTGSIEPGKQADLLILRTDRPNIAPVNDPIGAVVWGMDTSNIDWVLVGGVPLVREGALTGDVERARGLAETAARRVAEAAGVLVAGGGSM